MIVAAFDNTDPNLAVEERVALGLQRCGVSITCETIGSSCICLGHPRYQDGITADHGYGITVM